MTAIAALIAASDLPGSGDCEARVEMWGQPALLASSAGYIAAGLFVLWWARGNRQFWLLAAGLVLAGLGSMDYHGPAIGPEPQLHDGSLALALIAALNIDLTHLQIRPRMRRWGLLALTATALLAIGVFPGWSPALAAVAAVGLVGAELAVYRRRLRTPRPALWAGLGCLAVGVLVFSLSRTGGPLCDPQSLLQGHAVWHVLTAAALALWAVTALPERKEPV